MKSKAALVVLFLASLACAGKAPKEGTFYKESELRISKKEVKGSKLYMTFSTKNDRFHWCPGIKVQHTKKATVVLFVREASSKNGSVDQKAKYDRSMTSQSVVIETKNLDTYIRNGERAFKKIFSAKKTGNGGGESKAGSTSKSAKSTKTKQTVILRSLEDLEGTTVRNATLEVRPFGESKLSPPSEIAKHDSQLPIASWGLDVSIPETPIGDLRPSFSAPAKQKLIMNDFAKPIAD